MPTTVGAPQRSRWRTDSIRQEFVNDSIAARGFLHYAGDLDAETEPEPVVYAYTEQVEQERKVRTPEARAAAIADTTGEDIEPSEPVHTELTDPDRLYAFRVAVVPDTEPEPREEGTVPAYIVKNGNWRERHGLSRKRKSVPPSQTPEARRARHIAGKAARLGITVAEAERMTQRRQARRS